MEILCYRVCICLYFWVWRQVAWVIVLTCCLEVGMWTVTGAESFSRRDSRMLSPICPGFTPRIDITHTQTPWQKKTTTTQTRQRKQELWQTISNTNYEFTYKFTWRDVLYLLNKLLAVAFWEIRSVSSWERKDVLQPRKPLNSRGFWFSWAEVMESQDFHLVF